MESIVLWGLGLGAALALLFSKELLSGILLFGLFGVFTSGAYLFMGAPDVSFTSLALGAALTTFVYLVAIKKAGILHVFYVPTDYMIYSQETAGLTGFECDLIRGFAAQQRLEVEFHMMDSIEQLAEKPAQTGILIGGLTKTMARACFPTGHFFSDILPTRLFRLPDGSTTDLLRLKSLLTRISLDKEPEPMDEDEYVFVFEAISDDLKKQFDTYLKQIKDTDYWNDMIRRHLG